jgi:23S rRNA pseudouridine2457 synthase
MLLALNKPYDHLSQFTQEHPSHHTLAHIQPPLPKNVYPIGRLDRDSEGLLLLSDEEQWTQRLLHPSRQHPRTYHAQVDGIPTAEALHRLSAGGLDLKDFRTLPCIASMLDPQPLYPDRDPPIRYRKHLPTTWISLTLVEGKNRQVRRMTAAVGLPTLRLIRISIGQLHLHDLDLNPGSWRQLTPSQIRQLTTPLTPP